MSVKELKEKHVALGRQSTELSRQGRYEEAAELLEQFAPELEAGLAQLPPEEAKKEKSSVRFLAQGIRVLRERAEWASKAELDFSNAQRLIIELVSQLRWDVDTATVQDPRVQTLLEHARRLDPKTKALFSPRKVKVSVKARLLSEAQRKSYAAALAVELCALGLVASPDEGDELFQVTATFRPPVPAHLVGEDLETCTLEAKASWAAGGMPQIDLGTSGYGDETKEGDCINCRLKESVSIAAACVLRTWAR